MLEIPGSLMVYFQKLLDIGKQQNLRILRVKGSEKLTKSRVYLMKLFHKISKGQRMMWIRVLEAFLPLKVKARKEPLMLHC